MEQRFIQKAGFSGVPLHEQPPEKVLQSDYLQKEISKGKGEVIQQQISPNVYNVNNNSRVNDKNCVINNGVLYINESRVTKDNNHINCVYNNSNNRSEYPDTGHGQLQPEYFINRKSNNSAFQDSRLL